MLSSLLLMNLAAVASWLPPSDTMWQVGITLGAWVFGVFGGLAKGWYASWVKRRNAKRSYPLGFFTMTRSDLHIYALLHGLRMAVGASRAVLLRFHNGDYYIDGASIQKLSCTHEAIRTGLENLVIEAMPISTIIADLSVMMNSEGQLLKVEELPESRFRRLLESMDTSTIACKTVYLSARQMVGIVMVQWNSQDTVTSRDLTELDQTVREVGNEIVRKQVLDEAEAS